MYYFNFKTLFSLEEMVAKDDIGVSHGEDVILIFSLMREIPKSEDEKLMTKNLINLMYDFATKMSHRSMES